MPTPATKKKTDFKTVTSKFYLGRSIEKKYNGSYCTLAWAKRSLNGQKISTNAFFEKSFYQTKNGA